jgi:hypothetical protein
MANQSGWLDPQAVADELGIDAPDEHVEVIVGATADYVEHMRADLDYDDPASVPERVVHASVELAALRYQNRNAPAGFPGFGDTGDGFGGGAAYTGTDALRVSRIYRDLGIKNARTA